MEAISASHPYSKNADSERLDGVFFDAGNFFADARQRMEIRLKKIRGEKTENEEKILSVSNENSR